MTNSSTSESRCSHMALTWSFDSRSIPIAAATLSEDVAGEMESVLKGLGTNFSQAVRLFALQTTALGGTPSAAGIPRKAR